MATQWGRCTNPECSNGRENVLIDIPEPSQAHCPQCGGSLKVKEAQAPSNTLPKILIVVALILIAGSLAYYWMPKDWKLFGNNSTSEAVPPSHDVDELPEDISSEIVIAEGDDVESDRFFAARFVGTIRSDSNVRSVVLTIDSTWTPGEDEWEFSYNLNLDLPARRLRGTGVLTPSKGFVYSEDFSLLRVHHSDERFFLVSADSAAQPYWQLEDVQR